MEPDRIESLAEQATEMGELRRRLHEEQGKIEHLVAEVASLRAAANITDKLDQTKLSPPAWLTPPKPKSHVATLGFIYADAHTGEVVDPAAVDGLNAYDRRVSAIRHENAFTSLIQTAREYVSGISYDGVVMFDVGDNMSGLIHEELDNTNEETVLESVLTEAEYQEAGISLLADTFGKVYVVKVPGNHGRYKKGRPEHKRYVRNNFDWLISSIVAKQFRDDDRVTFSISDAPDAHLTVYSTRFLVTHGNQFRGGSGISGALAPLLLGTHRKTRREMAAGRPYDIMVMGHFHQRIYLPGRGLLVGGCLKGYDEFAYDSNFEPEPPSQEAFLITPERGITFTWPVFVAGTRKAEGW